MGHTESCLKYQAQVAARVAAYAAQWPHYCKTCGATGGFAGSEDVAGDGGSRMPTFDTCGDCMKKGKCPRCGAEQTEDWNGDTCAVCGWDWEDWEGQLGNTDCECDCWEREIEASIAADPNWGRAEDSHLEAEYEDRISYWETC